MLSNRCTHPMLSHCHRSAKSQSLFRNVREREGKREKRKKKRTDLLLRDFFFAEYQHHVYTERVGDPFSFCLRLSPSLCLFVCLCLFLCLLHFYLTDYIPGGEIYPGNCMTGALTSIGYEKRGEESSSSSLFSPLGTSNNLGTGRTSQKHVREDR
jgi:hypothetical protein